MNQEMHECCSCGYKWKHGLNGSHSCIEEYKKLHSWIPVKNRLPEGKKKVLTYSPTFEENQRYRLLRPDNFISFPSEATHFQPLPEPPVVT